MINDNDLSVVPPNSGLSLAPVQISEGTTQRSVSKSFVPSVFSARSCLAGEGLVQFQRGTPDTHNTTGVASNQSSRSRVKAVFRVSSGVSERGDLRLFDAETSMSDESRLQQDLQLRPSCYPAIFPHSNHQHPRRMYIRKSCCRTLRLQTPPNRGAGVSNDVRKFNPPVQSMPIPWARPLQPEPYAKHIRRANSPVASLLHPETGHPSWGCLVSKSS